jgi:hypothetical protein
MGLWRRRRPAFHTSADVRKDRSQAPQHGCRDLTLLGKRRDVCGQELSASEGSQGKAGNRNDRHVGEQTLTRVLPPIPEKLTASRKALAAHEPLAAQATHPPAAARNAHLDPCRARQGQAQPWLETRQARAALPLAVTEAEGRAMTTRQGLAVCYHVPMAADATPQPIVAHEGTKAVTEPGPRATLAKQAQAVFAPEQ